ncbi:MAG: hypothetical protein P4L74_02180 [Candidatus Doudnabacteria bacterium]|nr:hypothetical protein [Candidatus Doudnabacteria bacterium]
MAIKREFSDGLTSVEFNNNSRLAYTPEALRTILKDRQRVQTVLGLFRTVDKVNKFNAVANEDSINVTSKGYLGEEKWKDRESFYYKLDLPEGSFFVKRIPANLNYL